MKDTPKSKVVHLPGYAESCIIISDHYDSVMIWYDILCEYDYTESSSEALLHLRLDLYLWSALCHISNMCMIYAHKWVQKGQQRKGKPYGYLMSRRICWLLIATNHKEEKMTFVGGVRSWRLRVFQALMMMHWFLWISIQCLCCLLLGIVIAAFSHNCAFGWYVVGLSTSPNQIIWCIPQYRCYQRGLGPLCYHSTTILVSRICLTRVWWEGAYDGKP